MQVVLVSLVVFFGENSLFKCSLQAEIMQKNHQKPPIFGFRGHRDVVTSVKVVSSACYDKQQVCDYLQLFSSYIRR